MPLWMRSNLPSKDAPCKFIQTRAAAKMHFTKSTRHLRSCLTRRHVRSTTSAWWGPKSPKCTAGAPSPQAKQRTRNRLTIRSRRNLVLKTNRQGLQLAPKHPQLRPGWKRSWWWRFSSCWSNCRARCVFRQSARIFPRNSVFCCKSGWSTMPQRTVRESQADHAADADPVVFSGTGGFESQWPVPSVRGCMALAIFRGFQRPKQSQGAQKESKTSRQSVRYKRCLPQRFRWTRRRKRQIQGQCCCWWPKHLQPKLWLANSFGILGDPDICEATSIGRHKFWKSFWGLFG